MAFDPQNISLTETQVECLTFIEQEYMLHGQVPTVERISEVFGKSVETARKWMRSEEFDWILRHKGIYLSRRPGVLTANQLMIANMLLNIDDKRSKREKCKEAGVTVQQLAAWGKDSAFQDYMQKRAEELFKSSSDKAYLNVIKNMDSGDLQAAKFYLEMTGRYQPTVRHDINIDTFLGSLLEILQYRIGDPQILELIAGDIQNLAEGKPVTIEQPLQQVVQQPVPVAIDVGSVEETPAPPAPDMKAPHIITTSDGIKLDFSS
jgi:hypothetical protein